MSRFLCKCGHVIRDQEGGLPYKARLLEDRDYEDFSDWVVREVQDYFSAVEKGTSKQWLLGKGYGKEYVNLNLGHGDVLHDHIFAEYSRLKKDVYECTQCGRLHIERGEDLFISYVPEDGRLGEGG